MPNDRKTPSPAEGHHQKTEKTEKARKAEKVKKEQDNDTLDEALEDTFPASDPVSISTTPRKPASKPKKP